MPHIDRVKMRFGVLTVSDTCFKQESVDKSGPQIKALIKARYTGSFVIYEDIVPDELEDIKNKLIEWSDEMCDVIFTTGGTGISDRDVTPEATKAVIEKEVPGISFVMMNKSLASTPFAMLSRAVSGIRKKTLIINFPGSVKAVTENFEAVCEIIPHAISLLQNKFEDIQKIHSRLAVLPQIQPKQENIAGLVLPFAPLLAPSNVLINTVASRPRTSPYEMLSVDKALGIVTLNCGQKSDTEVLPIFNVMGRVLAEDVRSKDALPPFAASIKDGYAVKAADGAGLRTVVDVRAAGDNPQSRELQSGECVRISTGAPLPPGADSVVQVEDTELVKSSEDLTKELQIRIKACPKFGQDVRPIGSDIQPHTIVLQKGNVINAPEMGVLAAVGQTQAKVFKPRVLQKRTFLDEPSRDVVKNVIFYFDQQKNAGGFLFPIEKPTEAAAAAAGVARSTVIKLRRDLRQENPEKLDTKNGNDAEDVPLENEGDSFVENEIDDSGIRKEICKPKDDEQNNIQQQITKTDVNKKFPKIKITKIIPNEEQNSSEGIKNGYHRNKRPALNVINKKIKKHKSCDNKTRLSNGLYQPVKIINNSLESPETLTNIFTTNNENSESTETKRNVTAKKQITIETSKDAFLNENPAKIAAATGMDLATINLIRKQIIGNPETNSTALMNTNNKKIKIIKKLPRIMAKNPNNLKVIPKENFEEIQRLQKLDDAELIQSTNFADNQELRLEAVEPDVSACIPEFFLAETEVGSETVVYDDSSNGELQSVGSFFDCDSIPTIDEVFIEANQELDN